MKFKKYHESRNLINLGSWSNQYSTDTRTFFSARFRVSGGDYKQLEIKSTGTYKLTLDNLTNETVEFLHNGSARNILIFSYTANFAEPTNLTVSFTASGYDPTTINGINLSDIMLNTGSQPLPYEPYSSEAWHDTPHYIHNTSTDTIITLPADIYANDNNATVGLKGNTVQNGTPTPSSPIQPSECGDLETTGEHTGQYKIPILSAGQTTSIYLGEVETTRRVKKLVLTGEESDWRVAGEGNTRLYNHTIGTGSSYNSEALCNVAVYSDSVATSSGVAFDIVAYQGALVLRYHAIVYTTINDFKAYLQQQYAVGTPVTIWYVLAEPTTGIVNEPIRKIGTYADEVANVSIPVIAGGDTISVDTQVQPSEVSVNYKGWHPVQSVHEAENGQWD